MAQNVKRLVSIIRLIEEENCTVPLRSSLVEAARKIYLQDWKKIYKKKKENSILTPT